MARASRILLSSCVLVLAISLPGAVAPAHATEHVPMTGWTATDISADAGIYEITRSWGSNVEDYNGDGWPDVLISRHGNPARLYRNDQGTFVEVYAGTWKWRDRHDCAWGDVNVDGRPDVYCAIGAVHGTGSTPKEMFIQKASGGFVNKVHVWGVGDPYARARSATFMDANGDPYPDLFVSSKAPRKDGLPTPNRLFVNVDGTHFRAAPEYGLEREIGGDRDCAQAADFNRDGWEDILYCGKKRIWLYANDQGERFEEVALSMGVGPGRFHAQLVDLNGDGWLDLARVGRNRFDIQYQRDGRFEAPVEVRTIVAGERVAAGDVNGDGLPDLYVVAGCRQASGGNEPDVMLVNGGDVLGFVEQSMPQASQGCGQDAAPIDHDLDGRSSFIVLNGGNWLEGEDTSPIIGPVQMIDFKPPPPPGLSIDDVEGPEGDVGDELAPEAEFTITLSSPAQVDISVGYASADGSAVAGEDYEAVSGTAVVPAGSTTTTVSVPIIPDLFEEPDETFSLDLSGASGAVISDGSGQATLVDDDGPPPPPLPEMSVDDVEVPEGDAGDEPAPEAEFTITLSSPALVDASVGYATADGSAVAGEDYQAVSGTGVVPAGSTTTTVSVPILPDDLEEAEEAFTLELSTATGAVLTDASGQATVVDDDEPPPLPELFVDDVEASESLDRHGSTPAALFTLTLSVAATQDVSVEYVTADGTAVAGDDYLAASGTAVVPAGETSTSVSVQVIPDGLDEPDETFTLELSGVTGATLTDASGQATVIDDDLPQQAAAGTAGSLDRLR